MDQLKVERDIYENFRGNILFDSIKEILKELLGKKEIYLYGYNRRFSKVLFWLKDVSPMFEKAMKIFIGMENSDILKYIYSDYKEFKEIKSGDEDLGSFIELIR